MHDPPPVSSLAAAAPASLDRIVKKCLAKDPDERWQSARDLASALQWSRLTPRSSSRPVGALPADAVAGRGSVSATAIGASAGAVALWSLAGGRLGDAAATLAPAVHFNNVPDGNRLRRSIRTGWGHGGLQRGMGSGAVRAAHDPPWQR